MAPLKGAFVERKEKEGALHTHARYRVCRRTQQQKKKNARQ